VLPAAHGRFDELARRVHLAASDADVAATGLVVDVVVEPAAERAEVLLEAEHLVPPTVGEVLALGYVDHPHGYPLHRRFAPSVVSGWPEYGSDDPF